LQLNEDLIIEKSDGNKPIVKHFHNMNEIVYIEKGSVDLVISGKTTRVTAPSLLFINSLEIHSIRIKETPYVRYFMLIPNDILHHMQNGSYLGSIFIKCLADSRNHLDVSSWKGEVDLLFAAISEEFNSKKPMYVQFIINSLNSLLIQVLRRHPDMFVSEFNSRENNIYKVKRFLENNYAEKLSVEQIASQFYLSASVLTHSFKKITGFSPKQYLMSCRLAHARNLLLNSNDSITNIAKISGFQDVNNFIRFFRKEVGVSPLKYRSSRNIH